MYINKKKEEIKRPRTKDTRNLKRGITTVSNQFLRTILKFYLLLKHNPPFERQNVRKVLVYAYTGLGNFVLYTPALRAIKEHLPQASFTLLHGNDTGCQEVVKGTKLFDAFIAIKRDADWWTKLKWIYKLRKDKYDLVISEFHNNNLFMVLLTVLCGAKHRLGHVTSPGWENKWDFIYNIPVKMKKDQHEIDRYLEFAYALSRDKRRFNEKPLFYLGDVDRDWANKFLKQNNIDKEKDIVISVQLGTSPTMRWKQWSLDKYRELCDKILELHDTVIISQGSSGERKMIEKVVNEMVHKPIIAAGETTIKQAAALVEKSNLLICNDSGLMHIAVAVDTPVVAIYGPTDYTRTTPRGDGHIMIRKNLPCSPCFRMNGTERVENCPYNYKCLNSISVDEVYEVVTKKLRSD